MDEGGHRELGWVVGPWLEVGRCWWQPYRAGVIGVLGGAAAAPLRPIELTGEALRPAGAALAPPRNRKEGPRPRLDRSPGHR